MKKSKVEQVSRKREKNKIIEEYSKVKEELFESNVRV